MNEIKRIIFEVQLDKHKSEALRKKIWYLSDYLESFLLLFNDDDLFNRNDYVLDHYKLTRLSNSPVLHFFL